MILCFILEMRMDVPEELPEEEWEEEEEDWEEESGRQRRVKIRGLRGGIIRRNKYGTITSKVCL